jgi:sodium transport system ATP-binding protein
MESFADRRNDKLSTGQKQKVSIARTIVEFIRQCREQGKCVVFSTHIMPEAQKLCDRIVLIHEGRIFADGSPKELCERSGTADLEDAFIKIVTGGGAKAEAKVEAKA